MPQKWREGLTYKLRVLPADANKYYELDWSDWLAEVQATTINTTQVTSVGSNLTIANVSVRDNTVSVFQVANNNGVVGQTYQVDVRVDTNNNQLETLPIYFEIVDS